MKKTLFLICFSSLALSSVAQTGSYWKKFIASKQIVETDKSVSRISYPKEFDLFELNVESLRNELFNVVGKTAKKSSTIISLPNADGKIEDFQVFEASNFDEELQARFPEIRSYSGVGLTDRSATLKLSIAPNGIQTMVFRADRPNEFIEPYSADHKVYSVYKSQRDKSKMNWSCGTVERDIVNGLENKISNVQKSNAGQLKVLRLAQSCTGEYANYFNAFSSANVARVLAAFNATLTRCNGIFEKDLGVHLNLINQTTNVIFYNPSTDPYTSVAAGGANGAWNGELENTLNTSLTGINTSLAANNAVYDIGHLYGDNGGGGNAGCIGCVCVDGVAGGSSEKGSGFTSPFDGVPVGDSFDIEVVVHEYGHQLGANHTFTHKGEAGGGRCSNVQVEVGSGDTIMGYAGITSADVAGNAIDSFHAVSIAQIQANLAGKACPVTTNIAGANATPNVAITGNTLTIPISTPFALDCIGTDNDANDVLTYSWEQTDSPLSNTVYIGNDISSSASATKDVGPNFLSWSPSTSSTRYFPKMTSIMANSAVTAQVGGDAGMRSEALSSIARTLNFRVTVRDNAPYSSVAPIKVGQTNFANMQVTTNTTGGAFSVTSQAAAGTSYVGGTSQNITWNAGSTTGAPFNVANVDILITYNNGVTWTVLLAGTPNDGNQSVSMPNPAVNQTNCRIMVRSAVTATQKSYFFDVNNIAFTITHSLATGNYELQGFEMYPNPTEGEFTLKFLPENDNIVLKIHDISGREVFVKEYQAESVFNQNVSIKNAQSGMYLVTIQDGAHKTVKRIVIK